MQHAVLHKFDHFETLNSYLIEANTKMSSAPSRRSGGSSARKALRAAPLMDDVRPIRAGLEGGTYRPLTDLDVQKIHTAALDALETIGLADAPPSGVEILTNAGAVQGDDGRIRFPRALVEDMLTKARREITLFSRDGKNDLTLSGNRVHYGTAGAAVHIVDVHGNQYRECTVQDLHDAARIVDKLDNVHFMQRPMVCRDIPNNYEMDLNTIYACTSGTTKPMKFATESCEVMEACIRGGMPVLLLSAGMAGATAPSTIAGAITQATAECLAGLVYVNAIVAGHPAIFGTWPFGLDLRTGAMSIGSGEQALLTAGCAQMHKFYGLPGGAAAGASDSKMPDMQAGWEQMCSNVMAGLSGLNMVYEAAGMHASLLGFCLESLILSDDIIGQALRCVRGIEVTDETLALDQMAQVCMGGPGHYLGTDQTLSRMQSDYVYPTFGDRTSPKEWAELEKPNLLEKATKRKEEILSECSAARFDSQLDANLRKAHTIALPA